MMRIIFCNTLGRLVGKKATEASWAVWCAIVWSTWKYRNHKIFNQATCNIEEVVEEINIQLFCNKKKNKYKKV